MAASGERPRKGDRYVINSEFEAIVLTQWFAPFTGGSDRVLSPGMEFIVEADVLETATGISARPLPPERWESVLVDEQERTAEKYGGYSLVITLACLATHCSRQQRQATETS